MKKKHLLPLFLMISFALHTGVASAKIWRVNNRSNYNGATLWGDNYGGTAAYPVFTQINEAVAFGIVNNGDTIHLEGSTAIYEAAVITKKLVIIGTGYFLTDNPKTSNNTLESKIARINFEDGSAPSQAIGLSIVTTGYTTDAIIYVNVNDITVKRCRIERGVAFATALTDVYILENFFANTFVTNALYTNGYTTFIPPTGIVFNNNICQKTLNWGSPLVNPTTLFPMSQCNNNIFDGPDNLATPNLSFSTSEFRNNILMPTNAAINISAMPGVLAYNIGTLSTQFGTTNNNLVVPAITTLFTSSPSRDGAYQVAAASQASNNGFDGTDRGAFGGAVLTNRYTLSGLAPIPVIYEINSAGVANASGLPVTIKARTIK